MTATGPVAAPTPGEHGGDGARLAAALGIAPDAVLDLSASLNPLAPDVVALAGPHLGALRRYPDPAAAEALLADAMGVERERLLLTNGGAEAIALVAAERPEGDVVEPEFSLYRRHLERVVPGAPRWRSNPQNPTGLLAGTWTRGDDDAVVVGSLTKLLACPGLRIGYVLADPALVGRLRARQPAWSVNGLALAVLADLLDGVDLPRWAATIASLRRDLVDLLLAYELLPAPSDAPWVLVREAEGLRQALAGHGILVRDTASFGIPHGVRIAVPDGAGLVRLAEAFQALS